jgi:hypothetical protein
MVVASATEAELAALYYNAREACTVRTILTEMVHPQPPTPIQTDNEVAVGLAHNTVKQRRYKAIDMHFYCIRDLIQQGHFLVYWRPGRENYADYSSKHHPTKRHIVKRSRFLTASTHSGWRGCADSPCSGWRASHANGHIRVPILIRCSGRRSVTPAYSHLGCRTTHFIDRSETGNQISSTHTHVTC